ncbi:histidine utilization repressor [Vibrio maerlii]|uniref:histidine utilization repressor n=1 Tax=Vibrio maerlii TaxID=2231648 RepID=UPI000E3C609E|nr:histidine utilization repressor [Vibrio maerlii]
MSSSPRYIQIKQHILKNIHAKIWNTGDRITTELELTREFDVSRMTVNKAIRDLVNEGILVRKPRLGTFVREKEPKAESPLTGVSNIAEEIRSRGKTYSCRVNKLQIVTLDEHAATNLGLKISDEAFYSEVIHYEDSVPIQLEKRWVNQAQVPQYLEQNFETITPNQYLTSSCPLSTIEHTVEAVMPNPSIQNDLGMLAHQPCLLLNRRTWSDTQLVSFAMLYHPADRYKLSSKINV